MTGTDDEEIRRSAQCYVLLWRTINMLMLIIVLSLSVTAAFRSLRNPRHGTLERWYGFIVSLIPIFGPLAYFIGFDLPSILPSSLRSEVSSNIRGARIVKDIEGNSYVGEHEVPVTIDTSSGMPPVGQLILKTAQACLMIFLLVLAVAGNLFIISRTIAWI